MRYAIYYAPETSSLLHQTATRWLNRDDPLMAEPSRYGFHATLKAPFRLAPGKTEANLKAAVQSLAADLEEVEIGKLSLSTEGGFLSLRANAWPAHAQAIADECVLALDRFRAPLNDTELQRRRQHPMSAEEEANLLRHGYPHVLGQFKFHMTLSGFAEPGTLQALRAEAERAFAMPLAQVHRIDRLNLFVEPAPGSPFQRLQDFPLRKPCIWPEIWKWGAR